MAKALILVCEGGSAAAAFERAAVDRLIFRLRGSGGDVEAGRGRCAVEAGRGRWQVAGTAGRGRCAPWLIFHPIAIGCESLIRLWLVTGLTSEAEE